MLPYAEPLAHEMMTRGHVLFVDVRNPQHHKMNSGLGVTAYDVFADGERVGELEIRHYLWGGAKGVDRPPLRIKDVQYNGDVPGFGCVRLAAAEFSGWLYLSNRVPSENARENFTPSSPLFRLDECPLKFVTYETDSPERARHLAWLAEQEARVQTPPETHAPNVPA